MKTMTDGFRGEQPHDKDITKRRLETVKENMDSNCANTLYHYKYLFSMITNTIVPLAHLYIMSKYIFKLDATRIMHDFLSPGQLVEWLTTNPHDRSDDLIRIFPVTWRCDINVYGPSGTLTKQSSVCVSSQNATLEIIHIIGFGMLLLMFFLALLDFPVYFSTMALFPNSPGKDGTSKYGKMKKLKYYKRLLLILFKKNVDRSIWFKVHSNLFGCNLDIPLLSEYKDNVDSDEDSE